MKSPVLYQQGDIGITIYAVPLSILIITLYVLSSFGIHEYKRRNRGSAPCCHESSVATILGVILGGVLKLFSGHAVVFDKNLFFYLVLPPVIFSAGYSLRRRNFFKYFHLIFVFGLVGTLAQFGLVTVAAKYLAYVFNRNMSWSNAMLLSAVLSASDEVSAMSLVRMTEFPRLGALIFGEGVLNDSLSIVIFKVLLDWNEEQDRNPDQKTEESLESLSLVTALNLILTVFSQLIFSTLIGSTMALINAKIFKTFSRLKEHPVHQTSLVLLFGYFAYALAESVDVSGIVSVFVAGITLAHYSWHSLSKSAQLSTKICLLSLSDIAEAFAFAYVGLSLWSSNFLGSAFVFALATLLALVLARLITVFGLCKLLAIFGGSKFELPLSEQLGLAVAGMVRGSLCWATVLQVNNDKGLYVTTVMVVIMITTFSGGIVLPLLMPLLVGSKSSETSVNIVSPLYVSVSTRVGSPQKTINLSKFHKDEIDLSPMRVELDNLSISPTPYREREDVSDNVSAVLYLLWVKFDEIIMKPNFGGSSNLSRNFILEETKSMSLGAIFKDDTTVKEIVSLSKDHRVEMIDKGANVSRKIVLFDDAALNEEEYLGVFEQLEEDEKKRKEKNSTTSFASEKKSYGTIGNAIGMRLNYDEEDQDGGAEDKS